MFVARTQVTAHVKTVRVGAKEDFINLELTRSQVDEWINVLSVGLMESREKKLHFIIHAKAPRQTCARGSCEGSAEGDFVFVRPPKP
jgi:hypothetical protein